MPIQLRVHQNRKQYVPGGELYSLLEKRGRLSEIEAKKYFYQVLTAVHYLHNHGIAHRDIKPENILLDELKNIKLGDFGFSNVMKDGVFMRTSCGSANYAAPEIVSGQPYSGSEADTWSLGVLLFALLAGALPFDEATMPALISKIKEASFSIPYHFSTEASDLIKSMILVNPLYRIPIADIFKHPWISKSYDPPLYYLPTCEIIDEDLFETVLSYPEFSNIQNLDDKRNKIYSNDSFDLFVVSYRMLLFEKTRLTGRNHGVLKKMFEPFKIMKTPTFAPNDWQFCFQFNDSQECVMVKVCEALSSVGACWRFLTPFHMKIVCKRPGQKKCYIKAGMRLYEENKLFFLDMWKTKGNSVRFMDWCSDIYVALFKNDENYD